MAIPGKRRSSKAMGSASNWMNYLSLPRNSRPHLKAGQTVSIESKFLFSARGIENTFIVTGKGSELLAGLADDIVCH